MPYSGQSDFYRIPYGKDGDTLAETEEEKIVDIIENQCRGAILANGFNRVYEEGTFNVVNGAGDVVTVSISGTPATRGLCAAGFLEVFGTREWINLTPGTFWYLYYRGGPEQYEDPGAVLMVASDIEINQNDHLFMATLDNTVAGAPVLDTSPAGKPTGANLFDLLNSPIDPFGSLLTQSNLLVTNSLRVENGSGETLIVTQISAGETVSLIRLENASSTAEIESTGELRFQDTRLSSPGLPISDASNDTLPYGATSFIGAARAAMTTPTVTLVDGAAIATDVSLGNVFEVTLGGNRTLSAPTNPVGGQKVLWRFIQDGAGSRTITLDAVFNLGTDVSSVVLSLGGGDIDYMEAIYNAGSSEWDVIRFVRGY